MQYTFTSRLLKRFGYEKKEAPDMGRSYRDSFESFSRPYFSQDVDYKHAVGNLDGHSLVMCVVNYTGTRLPEAKPVVSRKNKDGKVEQDFLHDLARLIRRPNKHFIWANYCLAISVSWWIDGNVYFIKERDGAGDVIGLWFIPHYMMKPRWLNDGRSPVVPPDVNGEPSDTYLSHYQFTPFGKSPILYPARDVVHIKRGCDADRRGGVSGFEPLIKELYGDDKMAAFTAAIMSNMGIQVPIISPKDRDVTINQTDAEAMKQSWIMKTTGARAGEPVILTEPVDVDKFGFSPTELDLSKLRMIPESRVAAVLGIPAPTLGLLVGLQNGTSYASSEQARQQGYEEVVIPMQQAFAEEIQWQLLPEFEDTEKTGAEFGFDTSQVRVLAEDRDALFKRQSEALRSGGITINQFLTSLSMDTVEGGDVFYVPSTSTPMTIDRIVSIADGTQQAPPVVTPPAAKMAADIDRLLEQLESQMKEFTLS